jgi:uncharacterized protein YoxC
VIDEDPWSEKPTRRRRPRKAMDRSEADNDLLPENMEPIALESDEIPESAKKDSQSNSTSLPESGEKSTKKKRAVISSDEISQSGADEEIDVTELARLKRNVQIRFFVFFVIGLVVIGFTGAMTKLVAIGSPIAVMTMYVISTYKLTRLRTAKTLFADSVYYMGFLFTFVTLMFAISPEKTDIQVIINQMGVALSTTIFGMLVRVIMSHFDGIEMNVDEDVFAKLSETANKIEAITDSLVKASKEQVLQISATSNQAQHTLEVMQSRIDLIMSDDFLSSKKINLLQEKLDKIASTLDQFESRVGDTGEALGPISEALKDATKISQEFAAWRLRVSDLDSLVEQLQAKAGSTDGQAGEISMSIEKLKDQIETAKNQIALHMADAENLGQHVTDRLTKILQAVRT